MTAVAVQAEPNSINIRQTAIAATQPQQEHAVQTAAGAGGMRRALLRLSNALRPASLKAKQRVTAAIREEPYHVTRQPEHGQQGRGVSVIAVIPTMRA